MLGELFSIGSTLLNHHLASDRQDDAQSFSAQQFATRYQTTVKDMEAAGLNPALAYQQGGGSPPSSTAASASGGDVGAIHLQSKMNNAQVANVEADTENKKAQADLIAGQAAAAWATANQSGAMVNQINATVDKIREEIKNIPSEGQRIRQATQMLSQQSTLMAQQGKSEQERQGVLRATAHKLRAEGLIADADYKAIVSTGGVGRIAREVKPISDMGSDWLSPSKWWTNKSSSSSTVHHTK
jgi:hypothetical protein